MSTDEKAPTAPTDEHAPCRVCQRFMINLRYFSASGRKPNGVRSNRNCVFFYLINNIYSAGTNDFGFGHQMHARMVATVRLHMPSDAG